MKLLKILPIIAITLLAACKSTVPQTESLLEEHVSSAGEISSSSDEIAKSKYANPKDSVERFEQAKDSLLFAALYILIHKDGGARIFSCGGRGPDILSCDVQIDENILRLNALSVLQNIKTSITISKGIATVREEFTNHFKDAELAEFCKFHKNDPKVKHVEHIDNVITFTLEDDFSDIDLGNLAHKLKEDCNLMEETLRGGKCPNLRQRENLNLDELGDLD